MFLDYFALFCIVVSVTLIFYTFIYIHELPHKIAKQREHPKEDAIGVACWLSLFTLHAIWPIVFIWAVSYKKRPGAPSEPILALGTNGELAGRLAVVEQHLLKLQATAK